MSRTSDDEDLNRVFRCLADPSRRQVLALLRESGELKVGDIAAAFDMSLNGISKHLKAMERAGLIQRRIEGRTHWMRVQWAALGPAHTFLDAHRHFWNQRLDGLVDCIANKEGKRR